MTDNLKRICARLTFEEKVELVEYIIDNLEETRKEAKSSLRCSILLGEMAKILGEQYISYESRNPQHMWARTMVAYQMVREGYSTMEIGRQMHKDHSTILYLKHKMEDVLDVPQAYRDILPIWEDFQKRIRI